MNNLYTQRIIKAVVYPKATIEDTIREAIEISIDASLSVHFEFNGSAVVVSKDMVTITGYFSYYTGVWINHHQLGWIHPNDPRIRKNVKMLKIEIPEDVWNLLESRFYGNAKSHDVERYSAAKNRGEVKVNYAQPE